MPTQRQLDKCQIDYKVYGEARIKLPYDAISPFGTYPMLKKHEFVFKLFQSSVLPRGSVYSAFLHSSMNSYTSKILDVKIANIKLRLNPQDSGADRKFLARGKNFDKYEWEILAKACKHVESPVFIDVGANTGVYSFLLAKAVPGIQVLAVEPHPGIKKQLEYNISLNTDCNIKVCELAVSDHDGRVKMRTGISEISVTRIESDGDVEVECATLYNIAKHEKISRIDALKIDVEGHEDRVLIPYLNAIPDSRLPRAIVIEAVTSGSWSENPIDIALDRGYTEVKRNKMNSILVLDK